MTYWIYATREEASRKEQKMTSCGNAKQDAHQFVGQAKLRVTKIRPKTVGGVIFGPFSNVDSFPPELSLYGDVVSGVVVDPMGVKVLV